MGPNFSVYTGKPLKTCNNKPDDDLDLLGISPYLCTIKEYEYKARDT